ncbi:MAG: hypothetical protein U1E78_11440 [Gammaproteobacteria bacterium]
MKILDISAAPSVSGGLDASTLLYAGLESAIITMSLKAIAASHPYYGEKVAALGTLYVIAPSISGAFTDLLPSAWLKTK